MRAIAPLARAAFDSTGRLPDSDDLGERRAAAAPVLAYAIGLGKVGATPAYRAT